MDRSKSEGFLCGTVKSYELGPGSSNGTSTIVGLYFEETTAMGYDHGTISSSDTKDATMNYADKTG
ncbi:MAG: hypothetical protein EOO38_26935 [Cytophagaceae bacterium]|nr:MAG: hypothetical protein EOO38_26935 [Cytophagaceae bacterium]